MATKRLTKELQAYNRDPSAILPRLEPLHDDNLLNLTADLLGPEGTAYEGGKWTLLITLPPTYPNAPPSIRFQTPICHPNVSFRSGEICLDLLQARWTPAYGVVSACEAVAQLLAADAQPDSPLNVDVARLMRDGDGVAAAALVRFYTWLYAVER